MIIPSSECLRLNIKKWENGYTFHEDQAVNSSIAEGEYWQQNDKGGNGDVIEGVQVYTSYLPSPCFSSSSSSSSSPSPSIIPSAVTRTDGIKNTDGIIAVESALSPLRWMILDPPTFNHHPNPPSSMTYVPPIQSSTYTTHNYSKDQNMNIDENENEKLKKTESNQKIDHDKEFEIQPKKQQISENNIVEDEINEFSYNDFICTPGDFIIMLGPMNEKMNMSRNTANLDDNSSKLALNGQEVNGKIGFWKSE